MTTFTFNQFTRNDDSFDSFGFRERLEWLSRAVPGMSASEDIPSFRERLDLLSLASPPHHLIRIAPQVRPAPKASSKIISPFLIRPSSTASVKATALDAADIFPYFSILR